MKKKIQKILLAFLLFAVLNMIFAPSVHADFWGATEMSFAVNRAIEQMTKSMYDTVVANLKIAAIRILQAKLFALLGTNNSSTPGVTGMIISDWKMFIYSSAMRYSDQVTTDFFRGLSSGAASGMQQRVIMPAQMAVNTDYWGMRPNLQNYVANGDASLIFQAGKAINPWVAWQAAAQPQNDLAFTYLRGVSFKQAAYDQQAAASQAEGVAGQGVKGKEKTASNGRQLTAPGDKQAIASNGRAISVPAASDYKGQNIVTTGSQIGSMINEINMMPMRMLSFAQTIPQVVTSMVNQMISQYIQQGATNIINGSNSGGSSAAMSQQFQQQSQMLIQNGVRTMASPNMFFGR
ncbi:MAG TPA: hypothetical protein VK254_04305 [Candidatus Bathyarchaeia archaeon]|nr:hypothetical protein [Candidatus Bathyarchaeia archaeon]